MLVLHQSLLATAGGWQLVLLQTTLLSSSTLASCFFHDQCLVVARLVSVRVSLQRTSGLQGTPDYPSLHGTNVTMMFKLFHARWAEKQRVCLLELVVVHNHESHAAVATFAGLDTASRRLATSRSSPGYASASLISSPLSSFFR